MRRIRHEKWDMFKLLLSMREAGSIDQSGKVRMGRGLLEVSSPTVQSALAACGQEACAGGSLKLSV